MIQICNNYNIISLYSDDLNNFTTLDEIKLQLFQEFKIDKENSKNYELIYNEELSDEQILIEDIHVLRKFTKNKNEIKLSLEEHLIEESQYLVTHVSVVDDTYNTFAIYCIQCETIIGKTTFYWKDELQGILCRTCISKKKFEYE